MRKPSRKRGKPGLATAPILSSQRLPEKATRGQIRRGRGKSRCWCEGFRRFSSLSRQTQRRALLKIRKLVFRHDTLDLVGLDAISKAPVGLDRQASNDGVNPRLFGLKSSLRTLRAMTDGVVQPVDM